MRFGAISTHIPTHIKNVDCSKQERTIKDEKVIKQLFLFNYYEHERIIRNGRKHELDGLYFNRIPSFLPPKNLLGLRNIDRISAPSGPPHASCLLPAGRQT